MNQFLTFQNVMIKSTRKHSFLMHMPKLVIIFKSCFNVKAKYEVPHVNEWSNGFDSHVQMQQLIIFGKVKF
jgi:hypothetical protein